jgi:energy-coupling factor transporter ATP-binding protein EcfA2
MKVEENKFRKLFVVEPTHDISILSKYCNQVVFLTNGDEKTEELSKKIPLMLQDFNPDEDALIPMGRVASCTIAGIAIASQVHMPHYGAITSPSSPSHRPIVMIGLYRGNEYSFVGMEIL